MVPEKQGSSRSLRSLLVLLMLVLGTLATVGVALASAPTSKQTALPGAANSQTRFVTESAPGAAQGVPHAPEAPVTYQLDDGSIDRVLGFGNNALTIGYAYIWLNRFTPANTDFPVTLNSVSIYWPRTAAAKVELVGKEVKLLVYQDSDGDDNPANAVLLEEQIVTIGMTSTFETYPVDVQVLGPGDIYVGFESYFAEQHISPLPYPASVDTATNQLRSWVFGEESGNPPDIDNLGNNDYQLRLSEIIAGNLMIRANGLTQNPDGPDCSPQMMPNVPQQAANPAVAPRQSATGQARFDGTSGSSGSKPGPSAPAATLTDTFVVDDGTYEYVVRFGSDNLDTGYAAIWLNRFTPPHASHYPLTVRTISILWPNPDRAYIDLLHKQVTLLVYQDSDADGDPANATLIFQQLATIPNADLFVDYPVNVTVPGPGDLYVGFESTFAKGPPYPQPAPGPVGFDTSSGSKGRSYAYGMQEVDAQPRDPNKENLGANTLGGQMDSFGLHGNFLIRATGLANTVACTATPTLTATSTATNTATATATATNTATSTATSTRTSTSVPSSTGTAMPSATATACAIEFADVQPGDTFYSFVRCLACRGIVTGYPCGGPGEPCNGQDEPYYRPGANVTRGQLSKIIANSAGLNDPVAEGQQQFADVEPGDPFYLFVERLGETGAIAGYPCGEFGPSEPCDDLNRPYFRPNSPATRGQISKIVSIAAGYDEDIPAGQQTFTDVPTDSPFWVFIERLAAREIISGYGEANKCPTGTPCFRYNDLTTRGQMAKIAANAFFPNCQTPARP